ncbi:probable G-protein coupled receptor 82 [Poecilia reticulata]|uniref:G protein-coupled receptor 82 n=1 Tax=Poecilia reticulata TaxID=8081 RepID=A0A3P9Q9P5_POERE|nr:PREDICTED: probable G-protein coupled receptor 82 [Poecilia reticulata]XP_008435443.1 PREDICTED: probable G-protein coupled receptor 82 [Poecilia reticulata]XP_008435452.1 PREDICTED: probable G-protein coupled receptor 82 [Poecilia reticulata]
MENPSEDPSSQLLLHNASCSLCPSAATLYFLPSIYALLFLTALPGNLLSLWVFLRCISSVSPTHVYLTHLSISNLLMAIMVPFLAVYYAMGTRWSIRDIPCQIVLHGITPVLHINIYISILILTWVALSRFTVLIRNTQPSRPSACISLLPHSFFSSLTRVSFANGVCATLWVMVVGGIVPVTVYYSMNEATRSEELCYSPMVETGGTVSSISSISPIILFFVLYLLVLVSYVTVLKHFRSSRRNSIITSSKCMVARVSRNIVVIQIVLSLCLLPYHIFKPIFIILAHYQPSSLHSCSATTCHPLSVFIELKNFLFLLAVLRSSTDPVMYFLLDRTFRQQTHRLLRNNKLGQMVWTTTGSGSQKTEKVGEGNVILSRGVSL